MIGLADAPSSGATDENGWIPDTMRLVYWCDAGCSARGASRPGVVRPGRVGAEMTMGSTRSSQDIDLDLMQRVAAGDQGAVEELYDRFGSLVYRLAYQQMPTRADAEDAVQEIFVRLWRTADRYDPKRAALVTWVMLLSRRHLVDRLRRAKARVKPSALDEQQTQRAGLDPVPGSGLESDERFAALRERIQQLPELQRTVVVRAYLGGQTLRQIGEELDTPIGTIKSALSRALVRLRERSLSEEFAPCDTNR